MSTALTAYLLNGTSTDLATARLLGSSAPASETSTTTKIGKGVGSTGWGELRAAGYTSFAAASAEPAPSGYGFNWDSTTLDNQQLNAGSYTPSIKLASSASGVTVTAYVRIYKRNGSTYTLIAKYHKASIALTTSPTTINSGWTEDQIGTMTAFYSGDNLYTDVVIQVTTNTPNSNTTTVSLYQNGGAAEAITTPGYQTITPGLLVKQGSFISNNAAGTQDITDVGFSPKVYILWSDIGSSSDGYGTPGQMSIGWTDLVNGRTQMLTCTNGASTSSLVAGYASSGPVVFIQNTGATITASHVCTLANGFRLNWAGTPAACRIHYLAIGGNDLTNAASGTTPNWTGTGTTGHTVTGLGFQPEAVLLMAMGNEGSMELALGAAVSSSKQWGVSLSGITGVTSGFYTRRYQRTDAMLLTTQGTSGADTETLRVALSSMDSGGFTVNCVTNSYGVTAHYLCLKTVNGNQIDVGAFNKSTGANAVDTVTPSFGSGNVPAAVLEATTGIAASTSPSTNARLSIGGFDGTTQGNAWMGITNNTLPTVADIRRVTNKALTIATEPSTTNAEASGALSGSDFTNTWTTNNGSSEQIMWLAFGGKSPNVAVTPGTDPLSITVKTPALNSALQPGVRTLGITGLAPTLSFGRIITPPKASLAISGQAPTLKTTLTPATKAVTITGKAPTIGKSLAVAAAAMALTAFAPTARTPLTPGTRAVSVTTYAPKLNTTLTPGTRAISLTDYGPTLKTGLIPGTRALSVTGLAPSLSITTGTTVTPGVGSLTISGKTPALSRAIIPGAASLAISGKQPYLKASVPLAQLHVTSYAPTIKTALTPATRAVTITGQTAALGSSLNVPKRSVSITTYAPAVQRGVIPGTASLAVAGKAPYLRYSVPKASLTITTYAPILRASVPLAQLHVTTYAPILRASVPKASLAITTYAPTLRTTLTPATRAVSITGRTPIFNLGAIPPKRSVSITTYAPAVQRGVIPGTAALAIAGKQPYLRASVPKATLQITGYVPTVSGGASKWLIPGTATLHVTGNAPILRASIPLAQLHVTSYAPTLRTTLTPATRAVSITGRTAALSASLNVPKRSVSITTYAPAVQRGVIPGTATLAISGKTPYLRPSIPFAALHVTTYAPSLNVRLAVPKRSVAITAYAPAIQIASGVTVIVPKATLTITRYAPSLRTGLTPAKYSAAVAGLAPTLRSTIVIPARALAIHGSAVSLRQSLVIPNAALHVTGQAPALNRAFIVPNTALALLGRAPALVSTLTPAARSLTITGHAPRYVSPIYPCRVTAAEALRIAGAFTEAHIQAALTDAERILAVLSTTAPGNLGTWASAGGTWATAGGTWGGGGLVGIGDITAAFVDAPHITVTLAEVKA